MLQAVMRPGAELLPFKSLVNSDPDRRELLDDRINALFAAE